MVGEILLCILLSSFYVISYIIKTEKDRRKHNYIPGPYEFPIIGSFVQLLFTTGLTGQHYEKFHRICTKYGRIVFSKAGLLNLAISEDIDVVKEVLTSADWSHRYPDHQSFREYSFFKNLGLMWNEGESHKEMRKFTIRTLRTFGFGEPKAAEKFIQNEILDLIKFIDAQRLTNRNGGEISIHYLFKIPTFNILWRVMSGQRFSYDDEAINKLITAVDDLSRMNFGLDPEWGFPCIRFIPGCSPSRSKAPSIAICHNFFLNILKERREKASYKEIQTDYMDYFLYKIDQEIGNPESLYTEEQFQITCRDLLFGGLDTVSNTVEFAILYMIKYPEVQHKVQAEIDQVIGTNRNPTVADRSNLRYTEAVMLETFRYANIVPLNARTASCNTTLGGYNVKKDTICILNITIVHMSKHIWGDPEIFRPERFLDQKNNIINSHNIFPFGGGKRHCPGYTMAKVIWSAFFIALLHRYNLQASPEHPELCIIPEPGVANRPKPFYSCINLRKCDGNA